MDISELLRAGATSRNLQDKTGVSSSNLESPTNDLSSRRFIP